MLIFIKIKIVTGGLGEILCLLNVNLYTNSQFYRLGLFNH